MSNIWRRSPGGAKPRPADLARKIPAGTSQDVAEDFFEAPAGPQIVTCAAAFSGVGALVASALVIVHAAGAAAGAGTMTAAALVEVHGQAIAIGEGVAAGSALLIIPAAAPFEGVGTFDAVAEGSEGEAPQAEEEAGATSGASSGEVAKRWRYARVRSAAAEFVGYSSAVAVGVVIQGEDEQLAALFMLLEE